MMHRLRLLCCGYGPTCLAARLAFLLSCWLLRTGTPAVAQEIIREHESPDKVLQPHGADSQNNTLMLCTDGTVTGWGRNDFGQLGNGSNLSITPRPVNVGLPSAPVRVITTYDASFAILADGSLWAWGSNLSGILGVGSGISSTTTAMRVPNIPPVIDVAGSVGYTIALCSDGSVWSWGYNEYGTLGTGPGTVRTTIYTPQQIPPATLRNVRAIDASLTFCVALDADGHIWTWGTDTNGALGLGTPMHAGTVVPNPARINLDNVRQIDVSIQRVVALRTDGTVWTWGENANGNLGLSNRTYVNTPMQVGAGLLIDAVWVAINQDAAVAIRPNGTTYVWGSNYLGSLGLSSPAFAYTPISGPAFSAGVQVDGQAYMFTSLERTGTVRTWGNGFLGYSNTTANNVVYTPTIVPGMCPAVPTEGFPACGPQRAYYQRSGATYVAIQYDNTSPADLGTAGRTTVIDASLPPYNGTVVFDGSYHVRGNVRFTNGTFTLLDNTVLYVDSDNGQENTYSTTPSYNKITLEVQDATLQLRAATLQASCDGRWGGVVLAANARIYTAGGSSSTGRSVIRDAITGIYNYTPDWTVANTNEYYLNQTDFINNDTGLYDLAKGTSQPGEGALNCSFRDGRMGIQFESIDYFSTKTYGGNYDAAAFDGNTFSNLEYGMLGQAGALHVRNSTFINNYLTAISIEAPTPATGEISRNLVVVPAIWPPDVLARYVGYAPQAYGISASGAVALVANTVTGAITSPATSPVRQVGLYLGSGTRLVDGNVVRYLSDGIIAATNDNFSGTSHYIAGNTISDNVVGLRFTGYSLAGYPTTAPRVTLRCNTFATTQPNGVGVWVQAGTPFPASLGSSGQPNGNRFDDITDVTKRFVYDANAPLKYYRYNSAQEALGGNGNSISGLGASVTSVFQTQISGTGACGTSTTPGVYARSVVKAPATDTDTDDLSVSAGSLGAAYPNPATETVTFAYTLPAGTPAGELVIRDLMGRCVARQPLGEPTGKVSVSVQALPAGFYTGALETAGHRQGSQKLTVSH